MSCIGEAFNAVKTCDGAACLECCNDNAETISKVSAVVFLLLGVVAMLTCGVLGAQGRIPMSYMTARILVAIPTAIASIAIFTLVERAIDRACQK